MAPFFSWTLQAEESNSNTREKKSRKSWGIYGNACKPEMDMGPVTSHVIGKDGLTETLTEFYFIPGYPSLVRLSDVKSENKEGGG